MGKYSDSPLWADITPLPQNDGPGQPLAAILYPEDYAEAMSYLRAVIAAQECSERVLQLTAEIIALNPAHYTVWLYRAKTVRALQRDLREELAWVNPIALQHLKNYQIWHHRQTLIDALDDPTGEAEFLAEMFEQDGKNYHVWSYRQWMVKRFSLWDETGEWDAVEALLDRDVRNNSAWNHRWFLNFARGADALGDEERVKREVEYAKSKILLAPQNASPWTYLRGLSREATGTAALPLPALKPFASEFADLQAPDDVRSSHALDMLAEIYEQEKRAEEAGRALDLLAERYDRIRANYWMWRKERLGGGAVEATAVA